MRTTALVATCALLYGCATPWPHHVVTETSPALALRQEPVRRVDLLPVDLQLWTDGAERGDPDQLRDDAAEALTSAVGAGLARRGYEVGAVLDWQGNYAAPDGTSRSAMPGDALLATMDVLAAYGSAAARTDGLPVPFLPARLGELTGSDATLYVGGWAFVGDEPTTAEQVVKVLAVVFFVIVVVAAIAGAAGGHHHGHHHAHTSDHVDDAVADAAADAAFVAGDVMVRTAPGAALTTAVTIDAFGRARDETSWDTTALRPDWAAQGPHRGDSTMYVELTLVDNHTGRALWHARQEFPASAARRDEVERVAASLLAKLPPAR